jgi:hypothetical protein
VITQLEAQGIATEVLRRPADDEGQPWALTEFAQGWLVSQIRPQGERIRGGSTYVVERDSGRVVVFGSGVSPDNIANRYQEVLRFGQEVRPGQA